MNNLREEADKLKRFERLMENGSFLDASGTPLHEWVTLIHPTGNQQLRSRAILLLANYFTNCQELDTNG